MGPGRVWRKVWGRLSAVHSAQKRGCQEGPGLGRVSTAEPRCLCWKEGSSTWPEVVIRVGRSQGVTEEVERIKRIKRHSQINLFEFYSNYKGQLLQHFGGRDRI